MRLAASAGSPHSSIRPLVKPLFGAAKYPAEPLEISEEIPAPRAKIARPPHEACAREGQWRRAEVRRPGPFQAPAGAPFQEQISGKRPEEVESSAAAEMASAPTAKEAPLPSPARQIRELRTGPALDVSYQPLIAEAVRTRYAFSPFEIRRIAEAAPAGNGKREPDEINIHIGRIEVSAAPAPTPLPRVSNKARQSVSLDEYLKRGQRR